MMPVVVLTALLLAPLPALFVAAPAAAVVDSPDPGSPDAPPADDGDAARAAQPAPSATPSPSPSSSPGEQNPSPAPVAVRIDSPSSGDFVRSGSVAVRGTATPGSTVDVRVAGATVCGVTVPADGGWACDARVPDGTGVPVSVTATLAGGEATAATSVEALGPPTIDDPGTRPSTGLVRGTAYPGAAMRVSVGGGEPRFCPPADQSGFWSCAITAPDGTTTITATQQVPSIAGGQSSSPSASRTLLVDRTAPASPTVTSPTDGAELEGGRLVVSGRGESGGLIDVYFDGDLVCSSRVLADGTWRCTANGFDSSGWLIQVIQRDEAGNFSAPSPGVRVTVPQPEAPSPSPSSAATFPTQSPSPSGVPDASGPPDPGASPVPGAAPPSGGAGGDGARLSAVLPGIAQVATTGTWAFTLAVAAAFVALVALPLGLLLAQRRGVGRSPEEGPLLTPQTGRWVGIAGAVAVVTIAAGSVTGRPDTGLLLSVALGVAALAALPALAAWTVAQLLDIRISVRLLPTVLLAAMICAVLSRIAALDPPLLIAAVLGAVVLGGERRDGGLVALAQLATLGIVGLVAWLFHQVTAPLAGSLASVANDALAVTAIGGLVALPLLALPVPGLPGRALFDWSRSGWLALALAAVFLAGAVLTRPVEQAPPVALLVAAGVAAALVACSALLVRRMPRAADPR